MHAHRRVHATRPVLLHIRLALDLHKCTHKHIAIRVDHVHHVLAQCHIEHCESHAFSHDTGHNQRILCLHQLHVQVQRILFQTETNESDQIHFQEFHQHEFNIFVLLLDQQFSARIQRDIQFPSALQDVYRLVSQFAHAFVLVLSAIVEMLFEIECQRGRM
jgi:hypothetical protein